MSDARLDRDEIEVLAGAVGRTKHPALDDETIEQVVTFVSSLNARLDDEPAEAIADLVSFWNGYAQAGLESTDMDAPSRGKSQSVRERIKQANAADMIGLDLYQGLLKLLDTIEGDPTEPKASPKERTVQWAERVASLTKGFGDHLDDHR